MRNFLENKLKKLRFLVIVLLSVTATMGGVMFFLQNKPGEESVRFLTDEELERLVANDDKEVDVTKWKIDIAGEVNSPGVIEIYPGLTVLEVIELAGGFTKNADQRYIQKNVNLAQGVEDRQKIYIPSVQENQPTSGQNSGSSNAQINLNTASLEELDSLNGVGPSTAQKIIDARPFKSVDELKDVAGIGDSTFEKLKANVTI